MMLCLAVVSASAMGQIRTIKGTVIDKKTGNGLPGAEVSVMGGAESTVTDADGSFTIDAGWYAKKLTTRYAGMRTKNTPIRGNNVLVEMKKQSTGNWFLSFQTGCMVGAASEYNINDYYSRARGTFGLMGGYLGKWGGYLKETTAITDDGAAFSLIIGATKRIFPWMHASVGFGGGLGFQEEYQYCTKYSYDNYNYSDIWGTVGFEIGLIFKFAKHFTANIHYNPAFLIDANDYERSDSYHYESYRDYSGKYQYNYTGWHYWGYNGSVNHNISLGVGYAF